MNANATATVVTGPRIRTVLGDIAPDDLGVTNSHDHLFFRSPLLPGQELDDTAAAEAELRAFATAGGNTVAQWTPVGLNRRADALPALSRAGGVNIIAATGLHRAAHYGEGFLASALDDLGARFIADLTEGIRPVSGPDTAAPVKAGLIKIAGDFHSVAKHTRRTIAAAAQAHHATGAPIAVHLEGGTSALEVLDRLSGTHGVPPDRVILGHLNRFPDPWIHRQAAEAGANLGFDGPSRANHPTDWRLFDLLSALVDAGHADRILLGGDTTTAVARSVNEGPGMPYLVGTIRSRVTKEFGAATSELLFERNPARVFAVEWTD